MTKTEEERKILERIHYTIEKRYREVLRHVDIEIMKGSDSVLGMTPEDLVNEAILKFLSYIDDKLDEANGYANFDACIAIILKQNSKQIFIDKLRQHETTKKYGELVRKTLYDEDDVSTSLQEFEKVEIRDLSDNLNDSFKSIKRIYEEEGWGACRSIMAKFHITSWTQFSKLRDNFHKDLEAMGYTDD
jgi:hypothetical protein